jgi:Photosynthesis system II assembly factor YCF48
MTETPKIVHERLRAGIAGQGSASTHPDANVLNAFAEQALSLTEREDVLAHLALCATCRDVLLTALPEIVVPEPVAAEPQTLPLPVLSLRQRRALLWPSLRWAMLAAGVITAVLLVRPGFQHWTNSNINRASSAVQQPADVNRSSQTLTSETTLAKNAVPASAAPAKSELREQLNGNTPAQPAAEPAPVTTPPSNGVRKPPAPTTMAAANLAVNGLQSAGAQNAAPPSSVLASNRPSSPDLPFAAPNAQTAIVRAKPALGTQDQSQQVLSPGGSQTQTGEALASPVVLRQSPQWAIEAGTLKRTLDGGASWQTVLQPANSLLCLASRGGQLWVAGRSGTLLHSIDGGANWRPITVSIGGQALKSDIKDISLQDPASVILTTTADEHLLSKDGGQTWEQK